MNDEDFLAAAEDTHRRFSEHVRDLGFDLPQVPVGPEERDLINKVITFPCCAHLRGPRQITALLFARVLLCEECTQDLLTPGRPNPRLTGPMDMADDDQCDLCWSKGIIIFTPTYWQIGPLIIRGDICDDCLAHYPNKEATTIGTENIERMDEDFLK